MPMLSPGVLGEPSRERPRLKAQVNMMAPAYRFGVLLASAPLLCVLAAGVGCGGGDPAVETHAELVKLLKDKGLEINGSGGHQQHGGLAQMLATNVDGKPQVVDVVLMPAPRQAKEAAGLKAAEGAFAWGRFAFLPTYGAVGLDEAGRPLMSANPAELLSRIRKALP